MKEPLTVVFQRRAAREIEAVDEWWRANRTASAQIRSRSDSNQLRAVCCCGSSVIMRESLSFA